VTRGRLRIVAWVTLIVGLATAIGIYVLTVRSPENMVAYEIEHSKQYQRALELNGGKANVIGLSSHSGSTVSGTAHGSRTWWRPPVLLAVGLWLAAVVAED